MSTLVYKAIVIFQWICIIVSAIFALKIVQCKSTPKILKRFCIYSLIAATNTIFNLLHNYFKASSNLTYGIVNNSLLLFHFIFLTAFIYQVLPNKFISKIFFIIQAFFLLIIIYSFFTNDLTKHQPTTFAVSNFGLVIFCFFYYYQLFESMPRINLLSEPSFWIVNGIFFSMCATIPVLLLRSFLTDTISADFYSIVVAIIPFSYGIMHLFFIKAYLCSMSQSKAL